MSAGGEEPTRCAEAEPFALRLTDDSMSPSLPRGTVVVVDPGAVARDGSYVVLAAAAGPMLRRLSIEGGVMRVLGEDGTAAAPLSPSDILGVVVQSAGRRRRHHRRHD